MFAASQVATLSLLTATSPATSSAPQDRETPRSSTFEAYYGPRSIQCEYFCRTSSFITAYMSFTPSSMKNLRVLFVHSLNTTPSSALRGVQLEMVQDRQWSNPYY